MVEPISQARRSDQDDDLSIAGEQEQRRLLPEVYDLPRRPADRRKPIANESVRYCDPARPAVWITLAQRAGSALTYASSSLSEPLPMGTSPMSTSFFLI